MLAGVMVKTRLPEKTLRIIFAALIFAVALWTIAQTLTAQREFARSSKVRVACKMQNDIGGEGCG